MEIIRITKENVSKVNTQAYATLLNFLSDTASEESVSRFLTSVLDNPRHCVFVLHSLEEPRGCITMIIEPKAIHFGKNVAHLEDFVIHPHFRQHGYGRQLLEYCLSLATESDCYKVMLHCQPELESFYSSFGFSKVSGMRRDVKSERCSI